MPADSDISAVLQVTKQLCKDLENARARENRYCSMLGLPLGSISSEIIAEISDLTDKEIELDRLSASRKKKSSSKKMVAKKKAKKSSSVKNKKATKKRATKKARNK